MLCQNFPFHCELKFLWPSCDAFVYSAISEKKKKKDSSCFQSALRMYNVHARKSKSQNTNAQKKGIENEIALTYFPILPSGSILMHFYGSIFLFLFYFFGQMCCVVNFLAPLFRFRFHRACLWPRSLGMFMSVNRKNFLQHI